MLPGKYPIETVLPLLKQSLLHNNICILSAPPGAGKTAIVPPSLLNEPWMNNKKIIMLEPRRLAARRAAEYMASMRSEQCGNTFGYRIRSETVISRNTRVEIVTEGILTRMLQSDMELHGVQLVIFDEFHERSIHADTSLAFLLDVQKNIRPELKILIMSATPDLNRLANVLENPPVIISEGKTYAVDTNYLKTSSDKPTEIKTTEAVISALSKADGDILVFLPGKKEIKRTATILFDKLRIFSEITIHELYGELSKFQQDTALAPVGANKRKVILSTSLAETSITIEGIRIVIDCGLSRLPTYNIRRGMPGLVTVPVSKASADQRRGRAGRQQPGICYRLWTLEDDIRHPDFTSPEILSTDLTQFALELTKWGTPDSEGLIFIDPPPPAHLNKAQSVLYMLGAINKDKTLTSFGKQISELPIHPRLSTMIIKAEQHGLTYQACLIASILEEREITQSGNNLEALLEFTLVNLTTKKRITDQAQRLLKFTQDNQQIIQEKKTGLLLSFAYPDRLAKKKTGRQYQLVNGTIANLPEGSSLLNQEYLVIAEIEGSEAIAKIFLAAAITKKEILENFDKIIEEETTTLWGNDAIKGIRSLKLGPLIIHQSEFIPSEEDYIKSIMDSIYKEGINILPWNKSAINLRERSEWYRTKILADKDSEWPVLTDDQLVADLSNWLFPYLSGIRKRKELNELKMDLIIRSLFTIDQLSFLDLHIPENIKIPSGSRIKLHYEGEKPVLAVRLQELFGQTDTPKICNGTVPIVIHLLSPALRPLAITQDLKSFWLSTYPKLFKQMRAKYPKHVWPENPFIAQPTSKTKRFLK